LASDITVQLRGADGVTAMVDVSNEDAFAHSSDGERVSSQSQKFTGMISRIMAAMSGRSS
jgi:hypothetical protein